MKFRATPPNYRREILNPDGSVLESYTHCGSCMSIITGLHCDYCRQRREKKHQNLRKFLTKRGALLPGKDLRS